jgi:hypothetical protein
MLGFGNVIFVYKLVKDLPTLSITCVDIQRKFLSNAIFARKNTFAKCPWPIILLPIQMKNRSVVPNAIKNLKEMVTLKVTCQSTLGNNVTFVNFAVMAHIVKGTLINTS